jgi:exodeoxyribonuclease-1
VASLSDPRLRQLGRRLVAFHSPALLNVEETTRFNAYLREKWSADDVPETEWMTVAKAEAAIDALRMQEAASVAELDAITDFIERWSARAFAVAMSESSV